MTDKVNANRMGTLSATTLIGDVVRNSSDEDLGKIEDLMIDLDSGRIVYAVLSFGGFLGLGDKLFAIPWSALKVDLKKECFRLDIDKETLEKAPGFNKDNWPNAKDFGMVTTVYAYYGIENPFE
ncbi:MAG: PRC-barrel domain-containing protein [Chloroflexota bacterium]|nr:PRC-barrel domain-containing protein [Chloroflexota bacterium]